ISRASKPPPERPTRYSKPFAGGRPVSACTHVARIRSAVQRASPIAGGTKPRPGQVRKPRWSASLCFATISFIAAGSTALSAIAMNPRERLPLEIPREHAASHFAAESANLAEAHRSQDLKKLVAPGGREVDDSLRRPLRLEARKRRPQPL